MDIRKEWRIKVFTDCARGLKYLHKMKIIHQDLKPHNILIKHKGKSLSASLADFGIANYPTSSQILNQCALRCAFLIFLSSV